MTALPPPEAPDDLVATVLETLGRARAELRDAERIVAMLGLEHVPSEADAVAGVRLLVELQVAQHRAAAWQGVVEHVEKRARALGLHT